MKQKIQPRSGFSLVEVIVALGIVAFAFVGLLGIIPSGLGSFRQSVDQARALTALNMVASAARNSNFTKFDSGDANYEFPKFFSDDSSAKTIYHVRQANFALRFYILEDGTIRLKTASTPAPKAVLYLIADSPEGTGTTTRNNMVAGPLKINAFVVWPYRASIDDPLLISTTTRTALAARIGTRSFLDTVITHYPEPLK